MQGMASILAKAFRDDNGIIGFGEAVPAMENRNGHELT